MFQQLKENKDLLIVAVASFFIGFGAASFFGDNSSDSPALTSRGDDMNESLPPLPSLPFDREMAETEKSPDQADKGSLLIVENQRAGSNVLVKKMEITKAQWVVVQEASKDGMANRILGAGWFAPGVHENISIELLRETISGEQYVVALFSDAGEDKKFDHTVDQPMRDVSGAPVMATFATVASPSDL